MSTSSRTLPEGYAKETGINLMQKVFKQIADAQQEELALEKGHSVTLHGHLRFFHHR